MNLENSLRQFLHFHVFHEFAVLSVLQDAFLHRGRLNFEVLQELENRGLQEEGLYRVGGVMSKVKNLLNKVSGIDSRL